MQTTDKYISVGNPKDIYGLFQQIFFLKSLSGQIYLTFQCGTISCSVLLTIPSLCFNTVIVNFAMRFKLALKYPLSNPENKMTFNEKSLGVIFDLDGVLVDTAWGHLLAWKDLAEKEGFEISDEFFYSTFGMQNYQIIPQLVGPDVSRKRVDQMGHWKEQRYRQIVADRLVPAEGVTELIDSLKAAGFKLAVGSSAPRANVQLMLTSAKLINNFDILVSGEDVSKGKPDPETFAAAGEKLFLPPHRCVVVEDAVQGVEAGKAAKMSVVAVANTRKRSELSQADIIVDSLADINAQAFINLIQKASGKYI